MQSYNSEYSKVISDEKIQSANPNLKHVLTVEEYYDLLHHTHKLSELITDSGSEDVESTESIDELKAIVTVLTEKVNSLTTKIETIENKITEIENNYIQTT